MRNEIERVQGHKTNSGNEKNKPDKLATVNSSTKFTPFKSGIAVNPCTPPPHGLCYHVIPEIFSGYSIMQIDNGSTAPLVFKVEKAGTVFVVAEQETSKGLINEGWVLVDYASVAVPKTMKAYRQTPILKKYFERGLYTIPYKRSRFGCRLLRK